MATKINITTVRTPSKAVAAEDYTVPTKTVAGATEDFCAPIEAADGRAFFVINNEEGASNVEVCLVAGEYVGSADGDSQVVEKGSTAYLFPDSSLCKKDGELYIRLTPTASANLASSGIKVAAVQFLPVTNH